MKASSRNAPFYLFLTALIFSPLAFGTVEVWSYALMELLIGLGVLLLVFPRHDGVVFYHVPGLSLLLILCGWMLLQVLPLPAPLVKLLSPEAYHIYHQALEPLGAGSWMSLSLHPKATLQEGLRFISYALFYWLTIQLLTDYRRLKRTMTVVAVFAGALAFLTTIELISKQLGHPLAPGRIFWVRPSAHAMGSVGPYVNHNHYAGLMEMIFPLMVGLFLFYLPRSSSAHIRQRLAVFFTHRYLARSLFFGLVIILTGASVFISLSRGGTISLIISLIVFSAWMVLKTRKKKSGLVLAVVLLGMLTLTGGKQWTALFDRFEQIRNPSGEIYADRLDRWPVIIQMIGDFPLCGSGMGATQYVYQRYRLDAHDNILEHVHNDYLGFLSAGGLVLGGILMLVLIRLFLLSFGMYRKRRDRFAQYLFMGCWTGVLAILIHSLVDFNLQIGANGLYFFFVLALAVSVAHTRIYARADGTWRPTALATTTLKQRYWQAGGLVFIFAVLVVHGGSLLAGYRFSDREQPSGQDASFKDERRQTYTTALRAAALDPLNPAYHHVAAQNAMLPEEKDMAWQQYARALRYSPSDSRVLQDAGLFLAQQGRPEQAEKLMRAGIDAYPASRQGYLRYAAFLFAQGRVDQGLAVLKDVMAGDPEAAEACLMVMAWHGLDEEQMQRSLPEQTAAYIAFGDYLETLGKWDKAKIAYKAALTYAPRSQPLKRQYFTKVYRFFIERRDKEAAREAVLQGLKYFPDDEYLQRLYERL